MIGLGYKLIILKDLLEVIGEEDTKVILSDFYCPQNADIEDFLIRKAIEFEKQGISSTYLLFANYKDKRRLFGYFAVANKNLSISSKINMSNRLKSRINKFAVRDSDTREYRIPAILIAQLGKNFRDNINKEFKGEELLKIACDKVREIQRLSSGKFVYIECQDNYKLQDFYNNNGFYFCGKREREVYEKDLIKEKYLVQMIKYL